MFSVTKEEPLLVNQLNLSANNISQCEHWKKILFQQPGASLSTNYSQITAFCSLLALILQIQQDVFTPSAHLFPNPLTFTSPSSINYIFFVFPLRFVLFSPVKLIFSDKLWPGQCTITPVLSLLGVLPQRILTFSISRAAQSFP